MPILAMIGAKVPASRLRSGSKATRSAERAVGDVQDAHLGQDQRETDREEPVDRPECDAVEQLLHQQLHGRSSFGRATPGPATSLNQALA
jgi:hypothetical protein